MDKPLQKSNEQNQGRSRKATVIMGVGTGWLHTGLAVFVGLWLAPFLLKYMDREEYGLFTLAHELLMWLNLVDIGVSGALLTKASQLSGKPDNEKLNVLASTAFFAQLIEAVFVLFCGICCVLFINHFFEISPHLQRSAQILVGLLVIRSFTLLLTKVFSSLLIAYQRIYIDNLIKAGMIVVRTLFVVILVSQGLGIVSLGIGSLVATSLAAIFSIWRSYKILPALELRLKYVSWASLKSVLGLGIWFSLKTLSHLAIVSTSNIVTGKIISVAMITSLSLTGRLFMITRKMLFQVGRAMMPALGKLIGEGKRDRTFNVFRQYLTASIGLAALFVSCIVSANSYFIDWWVGDIHYAGIVTELLLGINLVVSFWIVSFMTLLTSDIRIKEQAIVRIIQGFLGCVLSVILGRIYGLPGIIGGLVIGAFVTSSWYLPLVVCREFKQSILSFVVKDIGKIVFYTFVVFFVGFYVRNVAVDFNSFASIMVRVSFTFTIGVTLGWFMILDKKLRKETLLIMVDHARRRFHKQRISF